MPEFLIVINLIMIALLILVTIVGAIACKLNCNKPFGRIFKICDGIVTIICVLYLFEVFINLWIVI